MRARGDAELIAESAELCEFLVGVVREVVDGNKSGQAEALQVLRVAGEVGEALLQIAFTLIAQALHGGDENGSRGLVPEMPITMSMYFSAPRSAAKPASFTT